jgi:hypothetical protein
MTPEDRKTPDWAHQERQADFGWIVEDLDVFWLFAALAFAEIGRQRPAPGKRVFAVSRDGQVRYCRPWRRCAPLIELGINWSRCWVTL